MNQTTFKALLLRDKEFLKSLYESSSSSHSKTILSFASDSKLNTLLRFLHMISSGQIKIKKEHFNSLTKKHLNLVKRHFESKLCLTKLLKEDRKAKLQILSKFCTIFPDLLFTLFNQIL